MRDILAILAWACAAGFGASAGAADWGAALRGEQTLPINGLEFLTLPSNPLLSNADVGTVSNANLGADSLRAPLRGFHDEFTPAELPGGGKVASRRHGLRFTGFLPAFGLKLLPSLAYSEADYRWTGTAPVVGGSAAPFDRVRQWSLGLSSPIWQTEALSVFVSGSAALNYETQASLSEALTWTGLVAGQFQLSSQLKLGAAFVTSTRLDDKPFVMAFPTLLWNPAFAPAWTVDLGTRGPAAALHWQGGDALRLTAEAGFQTNAFRMARVGPLPGGTASDRHGYGELRLRWRLLKFLTLEPKAGMVFGRRLEFFDAAGTEVGDVNVRPALSYGANAALVW